MSYEPSSSVIADSRRSFLLIGSGFVASALKAVLTESGANYEQTSRIEMPGTRFLDLSGHDGVPDEILNPDTNVVFLAAESSPEKCQQEPRRAHRTNVIGTSRFIERCLERGCRVLFFSSDTVYGETGDIPVDEFSPINPKGAYAEMKAEVESTFLEFSGFSTARMSYVVSLADKFTKYLDYAIKSNSQIDVFEPLIRTPIWLGDVTKFIISHFARPNPDRIINLCGEDDLSRKDILEAYLRATGENASFIVKQPSEEFYAARPEEIRLRSRFLSSVLGEPPKKIETAYRLEMGKLD